MVLKGNIKHSSWVRVSDQIMQFRQLIRKRQIFFSETKVCLAQTDKAAKHSAV